MDINAIVDLISPTTIAQDPEIKCVADINIYQTELKADDGMMRKIDIESIESWNYTRECIHFPVFCSTIQMRSLVLHLCWQMFLVVSIYNMRLEIIHLIL